MGEATAQKVLSEQLIFGPSLRRNVESHVDELCASIKAYGLVTPLEVLQIKNRQGTYQVVRGELRLRAIQRLEANGDIPKGLVEVLVIGERDEPIQSLKEAMDEGLIPTP
jgi:ParB-like chromosome segregation protein Spo0J